MAELNKLYCLTSDSNTATGECVLDIGRIVGAIQVNPNKVYTESELQVLKTTLQNGIYASGIDRIYPLGTFDAITDGTADPQFQTLGYGLNVPVRQSPYNWTFQFVNGGFCRLRKLQDRNGRPISVFVFDEFDTLIGTKGTADDGSIGMMGVPLDVFLARDWKANDGSNMTQYLLNLQFQSSYVNKNIAFVKSDFPLSSLKGLQDIILKVVSGPATGVVQIQPLAGCGNVNLYDLYSSELAAAALWKAFRADTGASIPVSSVAANPGLKAFTVTLDTSDTNYTALTATGKVKLTLDSATALKAADIVGYEGLPVEYVRGA